MGKKVMGDFGYHMPTKQMNGAMGNDIVDFFKGVVQKATTQQTSTQNTPLPTTKATNDKMMTYLKYGAMAVGGVALVIVVMKMMKKKG